MWRRYVDNDNMGNRRTAFPTYTHKQYWFHSTSIYCFDFWTSASVIKHWLSKNTKLLIFLISYSPNWPTYWPNYLLTYFLVSLKYIDWPTEDPDFFATRQRYHQTGLFRCYIRLLVHLVGKVPFLDITILNSWTVNRQTHRGADPRIKR